MNDDRDSYLCHLPGRTPVTGVPLNHGPPRRLCCFSWTTAGL